MRRYAGGDGADAVITGRGQSTTMRNRSMAAFLAACTVLGWSGVAVAGADTPCADLGGAVEAGNVCHAHAANANYSMDLRFPVDYADEQAITDYLTQNRDGFVNVAQMPGSRDQPYEMDATFEAFRSGQPPRGTQSVVLKIFQDVGGAHPSTWYKAFNYDSDQRRALTFDTLFARGTKPLDAIFPAVARDLEHQAVLKGTISPGDGMDPTHYQNFAITDDELIFFFGQGELLPSDAGATVAHVPRTAIPPLQL
jgi:Protein of unknown function (DUF3298)